MSELLNKTLRISCPEGFHVMDKVLFSFLHAASAGRGKCSCMGSVFTEYFMGGMKMSKKGISCLIALGCILLLTAGCAKKEPQTATISLPSNPSTGFEWFVEQDPELFDISSEMAEDGDEDDEALVGAGETEVFTLTPKAAGTATVKFLYERSWEDEDPDTEITYTLKVTRDMQISIEAMTAGLPGDASALPELPQLVIE